MKKILIINPKGGCGKTTLTTNLASYYALWEVPVGVVDYDPQKSSLDWISQRSSEFNPIQAIDGSHGRVTIPDHIKRVIMDAPARTNTAQLAKLMALADVAIVPVLPSPIDIRAAGYFVADLVAENLTKGTRVGLVGNRVRENTLIFGNLRKFFRKVDIPVVSNIRDTQNYIRAAESGTGIFEMSPWQVDKDIQQWRPIINWIESD